MKKTNINSQNKEKYWRSNLKLTAVSLLVWAISSFGIGIVWRDFFDQFHIGGAPFGFWFSQQGAIITFIVIIFVYCWQLNRLEDKYLKPEPPKNSK